MDQSRLEQLYEILPGIRAVRLYEKQKGKGFGNDKAVFDSAKPYHVTAAERRNTESRDEKLFADLEGDVARCVFHLWTSTIKATWLSGFIGSRLLIRSEWIIKEEDGTEWIIKDPTLEMAGTRWRCPVVEKLGQRVVS